MTRMTGPDCAVMCILINIHISIHTYISSGTGDGEFNYKAEDRDYY